MSFNPLIRAEVVEAVLAYLAPIRRVWENGRELHGEARARAAFHPGGIAYVCAQAVLDA